MKKIFTLLISSLFSLSLLAFDGSRLSIATATNMELKIEIDGRQFSLQNNSLTLSYLQSGYHEVKIFRPAAQSRFSFGRNVIIYQNSILLKRGFHFDIMVNRFGKVMIDERQINVANDWYNDQDDYYDSNNDGWNNGYSHVMNARSFETLKQTLRKEWFENNRLSSAKFVIAKNNFTTSQVQQLMLLFTFEQNRLAIAKVAFAQTVDQQNYYLLNDVLTFNSSKSELARFTRQASPIASRF